MKTRFAPLLLAAALTSCTAVRVAEQVAPDREAYRLRAEMLGAASEWRLAGRISLDDGERGGSGRLQWDVGPGGSSLDFHGAMGRGAWNLRIGPEGAVLREANGDTQAAPGVNALIQERIGWPIPVDALHWWVRGLAAPGRVDDESFEPGGLLLRLVQFGWTIQFGRYDSVAGLDLPVRLDARRGDYRVKLAISDWRLGGASAGAD